MKKNKILYRCYVGGYILWLFGALIFPMLLTRFSAALSLVGAIIAVLVLAALITSHVFYNKKRVWYPITSYAAHGANLLIILLGFIFEMVYVAQGLGAVYAIIITSASLAFEALLAFFLFRGNQKVREELKEEEAERVALQEKLAASKEEEPMPEESAE